MGKKKKKKKIVMLDAAHSVEGQVERPNNANGVVKRETMIMSGPLPHPSILKQYDDACPGAAERIIKLAEKQSDHRQELEKKVVYSGANDARLGLIFALVIGILAIVSSTILIYTGKEIAGGLIGGVYLVTIVSAFIRGSKQQRAERENRRKDNPENNN